MCPHPSRPVSQMPETQRWGKAQSSCCGHAGWQTSHHLPLGHRAVEEGKALLPGCTRESKQPPWRREHSRTGVEAGKEEGTWCGGCSVGSKAGAGLVLEGAEKPGGEVNKDTRLILVTLSETGWQMSRKVGVTQRCRLRGGQRLRYI